MFRKTFYKGNWHLTRFELEKLEILKEKCINQPISSILTLLFA